MDQLEQEIKELIIECLDLEDISTADIETDAPLFVEGLGLDSVDALEIGVALQKEYKLKMSAKPEVMRKHFQSVATIAAFVREKQNETQA